MPPDWAVAGRRIFRLRDLAMRDQRRRRGRATDLQARFRSGERGVVPFRLTLATPRWHGPFAGG